MPPSKATAPYGGSPQASLFALSEAAIPPLGLPKMCQGMMSLAIEYLTLVYDSKHISGTF